MHKTYWRQHAPCPERAVRVKDLDASATVMIHMHSVIPRSRDHVWCDRGVFWAPWYYALLSFRHANTSLCSHFSICLEVSDYQILLDASYSISTHDCYDREASQNHGNFTMMTSSNGNIFRVTGHLCSEFTGLRWIPRTMASDAELWFFLWSAPNQTAE